jgi:uncharacterized C2H2 Zn-finger protein
MDKFNKHIISKEHREAIRIYNETLAFEQREELEYQAEEAKRNNVVEQHDSENVVTKEVSKSEYNKHVKSSTKDNSDNHAITPINHKAKGSGLEIQPTYEYMCDYCNQVYKYKKSYETHIDKCYKNTVNILQSKITESTAKKLIKLLSKQGDGLGTLTNAGKINNNTVTHNSGIVADTVNTQNIQNNIINVFPFGNEDLSMLTDEVKINIYKRGFTAYENLLNEIYKHDQNKNIFIANQRAGIVKFINENKELEIGYIKDAIEKIYDTKKDVLLQIIDEYRGTQNKHAEKRIDDLEKAMNTSEIDKKYYTLAKLKLHQISDSSKQKLKEIAT